MDRDKLVQLVRDQSCGEFMDDALEDSGDYGSEEYPEFLADKIIQAFERGQLV